MAATDAERAWDNYAERNEIIEGIRTVYERSAFEHGYEESTSTSAQRIAELETEIEQLKTKNEEQYAALKKKWTDDWRAYSPDKAQAHDIIKRASTLLQSDRERADMAEKEIKQLKAEVLKLDRLQKERTGYWQNTERARAQLEAEVERLNAALDMIATEREAWKTRARTAERERDAIKEVPGGMSVALGMAKSLLEMEKRMRETAEKERDDLRAKLDAEGREWLRTKDIDRLQAVEKERDAARALMERQAEEVAEEIEASTERVATAEFLLAQTQEALKWVLPYAEQWVCSTEEAGIHVSVQRAVLDRARAIIGGDDA